MGTNTWLSTPASTVDLILRGAAWVSSSYDIGFPSIRNLFIGSNSWWYYGGGYYASEGWNVLSNATIEAGGGIVGIGKAYSSGSGRYYSSGSLSSGGGGANGGLGGNGAFGGANSAGGVPPPTGSETTPSSPGGRGGVYSSSLTNGVGGAALRMNVGGLLRVDGLISANGLPGIAGGAGGGAGGSLWLTVGGLAGSGVICADGGDGQWPNGGGGGGGRIAVYYG